MKKTVNQIQNQLHNNKYSTESNTCQVHNPVIIQVSFGWFFSGIFLIMLSLTVPPCFQTTPSEVKPIVSLNLPQNVDGQFFLGTGSVDTKMVYYYYVKDLNGGYHLEKADVKTSVIFQDESSNPQIKLYPNETWQLLVLMKRETKYEFHIPPNSIIQEYNPNVRSVK